MKKRNCAGHWNEVELEHIKKLYSSGVTSIKFIQSSLVKNLWGGVELRTYSTTAQKICALRKNGTLPKSGRVKAVARDEVSDIANSIGFKGFDSTKKVHVEALNQSLKGLAAFMHFHKNNGKFFVDPPKLGKDSIGLSGEAVE